MDRSVSFHLYYEPINHELHNLIEYFVFPFGFGLVLTAQDSINNWRVTALILTSIFIPAAGIWFIGKLQLVIPLLYYGAIPTDDL